MLKIIASIFFVGLLSSQSACSEQPISVREKIHTSFPEKIDPQCNNGTAKLFDECGDQVALFNAALAQANQQRKILLVEIGAEWCIWCHVFDAHINGDTGRFRYTFGTPDQPDMRYTDTMSEGSDADTSTADELRTFVAENFILVRIDVKETPRGLDVLALSNAIDKYPQAVPFVYVVDSRGQFVKAFNHETVETRREGNDWYRGYDRVGLLKQLTEMHDAATSK